MIRNQGKETDGKYPSRTMVVRAKTLRHEMTEAERALWKILRNRRVNEAKFRRQAPLGPYVLDFYCEDCRLAIELDGSHHLIGDQHESDIVRDQFLAEQGISVLRFGNHEVLENRDSVLSRIFERISEIQRPLAPSPSGRGLG